MKGNSNNPDFRGYVTRYNVLCSDGRTIRPGAFKDDDGKKVPLVYNHEHSKIENVIGHAILRNRKDGVYADCYCNDTDAGKQAKSIIAHGDVDCLSIYANRIIHDGHNVMHGMIREVSLVLAGANPEAYIDDFAHGEDVEVGVMIHADEDDDLAGVMFTGDKISISHSMRKAAPVVDEDEEELDLSEVEAVIDTLDEDQLAVFRALINAAYKQGTTDSDDDEEDDDDAEDEYEDDDDEDVEDDDETDEEDDDNVKHNVFNNNTQDESEYLSHSEMTEIIDDIKRFGSLKESFIQHGVEQIDMLVPEPKLLNTPPDWIKRDTGWVAGVMSKVHRTPFSRVKSMYADITADEARARGYIKGNLKKEEVFTLLKRTTTPTTVYKKQKFDRDDLIDITDFDFIAWIKSEMRFMLDEELARAILVGDGRLSSSDDKIKEDNIRPVMSDHDLYTIKATVPQGSNSIDLAKNFIVAAIRARIDYKGSGNPVLYTTEDILTDMLLITDKNERDIYVDEASLCRKLRVSSIVTVPVMEGMRGPKGGDLLGIIVNLNDYNLGADRGGAITMFDDFDIDYNAQKYLIETRCSGALVKPYSAIVLEKGSTYTTTGWGPETRRNLEPSSTPSVETE